MADLLPLTWRTFHMPKSGHTMDEYEDAFAGDPARGRFAIADGASESAFANTWAQILVNAFVQTPGAWSGWLLAARQRWGSQVQARELSWYAEAKVEDGAYAAMLGITFKNGRWLARAVGDCCLFQVRERRLLRTFPIQNSGEFGNRPSLVGSRNRHPDQLRARRHQSKGDLGPEDVVLLMTDALAEWFLKQVEQGRQPWNDVQAILTEARFVQFVTDLRDAKALRNDDVTLALIQTKNS